MPHSLKPYKEIWEHLNTNTLDNLVDRQGTIFDADSLEDYLTEDNGVKWGRDHETITITLGDNHTRSLKAKDLLHSWGDIIDAIPKWCLDLIQNPSVRTDEFCLPPGGRHASGHLNAFITPNNKWFIALARGFFPAERDGRGRLSITESSVNPPEEAEIAARWGNYYIESKRCSFPVAAEFSFEGGDTPLDQFSVKKLTYIISRRKRAPPTCTTN
eukprot:scaffold9394_cov124-Isochrysis_galbana.AAC.2